MPKRPQLDTEALDGLGSQFQEPIQRIQGRAGGDLPPNHGGLGLDRPAETARSRSRAVDPSIRRQQAGYIPADLNKALMIMAVQLDRKKEHLVEDAVREYLERHGGPATS